MILNLTAPGKTFLIGEYGILNGGSCLLASTGPRFGMSIQSPGDGQAGGIHPHSPAGKWIRANPMDFNSIKMTFNDPHFEAGGFGASSAQFLFVNLWSQIQRQNLQTLLQKLSVEQVWRDYRELYLEKPEATRPSGADIVSHWQGGITAFTPKPFSAESVIWPSDELEFVLVRTHQKVATHLHLEQVKNTDFSELKRISAEAIQKLQNKDVEAFVASLNEFSKALEMQGLVALNTQDLLARFKSHSSIVAAKGCGALGADVIALFYQPEDSLKVSSFLASEGIVPQASSRELAEGLKISVDVSKPTGRHLRSVTNRPPEEWL